MTPTDAYTFQCLACGKVSELQPSVYIPSGGPVCPRCKSTWMNKQYHGERPAGPRSTWDAPASWWVPPEKTKPHVPKPEAATLQRWRKADRERNRLKFNKWRR